MKHLLIGICSIGLLSACSTPAIKDTSLIEQAAINLVESGQQDIQATIDEARTLQVQAQQADLYYYSPKHMIQAEQEMAKAEEAYKLKKPDEEILTHSLTAKTLFERGLKIKPLVEQHLEPSFADLAMLKELKAHIILKDDFKDLENEVKDLIILIEEEKTPQALQEQIALKADVVKLEIATLKASYLIPAEIALEKAEDAEADDYAKKTYEKAEKKVEQLGQLIETQYQNRQLIIDASKAAVQQSQHAQNIATAVIPLLKLNAESGEEHILYIESLLGRIASAIQAENMNHLTLNKQSISLAQKVEILNKQAQTNQSNPVWDQQKADLEKTISTLQSQLSNKETQITAIQKELSSSTALIKELQAVQPPATAEEKAAVSQQTLNKETNQPALNGINGEVNNNNEPTTLDGTEQETQLTEAQATTEATPAPKTELPENSNTPVVVEAEPTVTKEVTPESTMEVEQAEVKVIEQTTDVVESDVVNETVTQEVITEAENKTIESVQETVEVTTTSEPITEAIKP